MNLSTEEIEKAIRKLTEEKDEIDDKVNRVVQILTTEGAEKAQIAFGSMAKVSEQRPNANRGVIQASARAAGVAEFGAGYAVMEHHPLAENAPYPVEVASYSKAQYPYGLFYITNDLLGWGEGYWFFGGKEYNRVQPKHGLLNAYDHIMAKSTEIAKGVFNRD